MAGRKKENLLDRITLDQDILVGKPVVRGMRISVELILDLLSQGAKEEEILAEYPMLERKDILACVAYARNMVAGEEILLTGTDK